MNISRTMNIVEVVPRANHVLYIRMDDGQAGLVDITPFLESEAFFALKNPEEFQRVRNGQYFIEWPCGADLSADTLRARWLPVEVEV